MNTPESTKIAAYGLFLLAGIAHAPLLAQDAEPAAGAADTAHYTGSTLSNIDYHHGQLQPAIGVHNIQVFRADRGRAGEQGQNWTYNHGTDLAYWNDTFYMAYLSNPVGEHIPPGQTLLQHSKDGYDWSAPEVLFPPYKIPDGTTKEGHPGVAKDLFAVMHQRMNFFVASNDRLLALGYYGICLDAKDNPNDGDGIGRVVREIYADGSFGPIYFIRYNHNWNADNTSWPFYESSSDAGFLAACKELLADPLMMQQWVEEADRDDPLIPLKEQYKAFSYYHLPDGRVVGWWKHALTSISGDDGKTWEYLPLRAPGFVNANAKIWGQPTSDGRYATVYNPSEFRWPLAISTSDDGLEYKDLLLVNGEITSMRYGGNYKSYGPQYVRGILEGNGLPPDDKLWVSYSMNKEDIWVASIPVPVTAEAAGHVDDDFRNMAAGSRPENWNIYSPILAPVIIGGPENAGSQNGGGDREKGLFLRDSDRFDYGKAVRVFPAEERLTAEFSLIPYQNDAGILHIEFQDAKGTAAVRLIFDSDGQFKTKAGYRLSGIMDYEEGRQYDIRVELDASRRFYEVFVNGEKEKQGIFFAPVHSLERIVFRTGEVRHFPNADTPTDQSYDLPGADEAVEPAAYLIQTVRTSRR